MKTNKIKIFFSIISFCFLVTSCNNLLSELTQQKSYIQISTNLDNTNQRTVLPNFSVVLGRGYTWELYRDNSFLQTWTDTDVKTAYQNMCDSKIEVDPGSYSFELKVIKEDKIILKSESQTVTIEQNKNNELNFVLCPPTENEAKGSVNFKLTFPNEKVNIVEANLFKPGDDKKESFGNIQEVVISQTDSSSTANITVNNVPAGSYLLQVDLCYQVADYSRKETINTYTTIVQVAAGFCSKAEVTLEELTDYYTITYMVDDIITTFQGYSEIPTTFKKNSNVPLPIAYNDGQLSIGWFNDPDCTEPVELNDNKFTITENTTLYTQWGNVVNTNDLSFDTIDATNNIEGLLIYTETGLNYFRNIVNGTLNENIIVRDNVVYRSGTPYPTVNAKLCSDINLPNDSEWVPIGNGKYEGTTNNIYYEGSFDGNGKGVTNLRITSNESSSSTESSSFGFFGSVKNATIMNLYVSGEIQITCNQNDSVGGIVGYAKDNSKIDSCVNNVIITVTGSSIVGGIIGSSNNSSVSNCINVAELSGESGAGIIGFFSNTSNEKITIGCVLNLGNLNFSNNGAGIIYIGSFNVEVSNSINTGVISGTTIYPICNNYNNNNQNSNTVTNCFYDSDKIQNVVQGTPGTGKITSWFYTEDINSEEKLSDWSFASGRYPLPSTLQSIFDDGNSYDDVWAKLCKAAETGITTWSALASAIEDETSTQSEFVITNNLVATETIEISRPITISGSGITITRGYSNEGGVFQNTFFDVYDGSLQIVCNNENKKIVFDGASLEATSPFISADANLSITNCVFKQNKITTIVTEEDPDGVPGSINVANGSFYLKNCDFSNNVTTGLGGAISINKNTNTSITSFIENCCFDNNITQNSGGGAIYIFGTTVQDTQETHTLKDCIFLNNAINTNSSNNGGAIYLLQGTLILDGVTMKSNRFYSYENTYVDSDIFVYKDNTFIKLKNKNSIECFIDNFASNSTPIITLDETFSIESSINFLCVPTRGASVDVGDVLLQNNNLTNEQISCFTIKDSDGRNYSLGYDGKLIDNSN